MVFRDAAKDFERGEDAEAAVEPTPVGHGVQMAAEEECAFGGSAKRDP